MLTSIRGLVAASILASSGLAAAPAFAEETDPPADITVTGNVVGVTDYRWRGLSYSGGDFAVTSIAIIPDAPARFSITNGWPKLSCRMFPIWRAVTSAGPPAPKGTITFTGREG